MTTQRLDQFVQVTVDGTGTSFSLPIGPAQYGERWHVDHISIQTVGNTANTAKLFVYRGSPSPLNQIDYTEQVAGDTSETSVDMVPGDTLVFECRNFTSGAVMTAHVMGTKESGR